MNNQQQVYLPQMDGEEIKRIRQQLASFIPTEGSLEVVFQLPNGDSVRVPVTNKAKIRLLSKEVRNYLAEEQINATV